MQIGEETKLLPDFITYLGYKMCEKQISPLHFAISEPRIYKKYVKQSTAFLKTESQHKIDKNSRTKFENQIFGPQIVW